ncbi:hypothetical protein ACRS6B_08950 [Nocardia asteroides]
MGYAATAAGLVDPASLRVVDGLVLDDRASRLCAGNRNPAGAAGFRGPLMVTHAELVTR